MGKSPQLWFPDAFTASVEMEEERLIVAGRVADLGSRLVAGLIDTLVLLPWQLGAAAIIFARVPEASTVPGALAVAAAMGMGGFLVSAFLEVATAGQTFGKNALGLRVTTHTGGVPTAGQILVRNLLRFVDALPACGIVAGLAIATSPDRTRLGDRAARTLVVYADPLRELMARVRVPESVLTSPDDGYMLETLLARLGELRAEVAPLAVAQLARVLYDRYGAPDDASDADYRNGRHLEYLRALLHEQKAAGDAPE